ncbi:MAG: DNRLRE domain-containing protein [Deltaproteobacteria bacterium]|nr:MAG: DNRLRE domain-containing protein [Deltaproteobacteria bacterium]
MKRVLKYGCLLLWSLLATEARPQSCTTPLIAVGPSSPANGFPQYYVDATQLALVPCLDPGGFCPAMDLPDPTSPVVFPDNFPSAFFYWLANARITLPSGGRARVTLAVEGTFVGGRVVPGNQFAFGRVRIRADGLVAGATYTFTHPYGVDVLQADGLGSLNVTNDVGTAGFTGPLAGRVGPFLVWDASPPAPPSGFVGNPGVDHPVTGSPCGINLFRIEGSGLPAGGLQTGLFSVAGKKNGVCGNGILEVGEECDDGNRQDGDCCSSACRRDPPGTACTTGNVCADAACDAAAACQLIGFNTKPCDDGSACTVADTCSLGNCAGTLRSCDDANVCTTDSCDPATGCVNTPRSGACDDHDACTTADGCTGGRCVGTRRSCDDGNVCTDDSCNPATGCVHTANTAPCDDGDACTTLDACKGGKCVGSAPPSYCDDGNVCTDDSCNPATGCEHTPNTASCNDFDACTTNDTCSGGRCIGRGARNCDDGNPCTDDSCSPLTGCVHTPNSAPCDDLDACTVGDTCAEGRCVGAPRSCDDGNGCTDDACRPETGCVHTANRAPCDDGDACTTGDTCSGGRCMGGAPPRCDDSNPCTDDACRSDTGCVYVPNAASCDDGNACTTGDTCTGGRCKGATLACDDGNPCTDDACDPQAGCGHVFNTAACDDGDACTTGDACAAGKCVGGGRLGCDDGNPCTDDACDPAHGCAHDPNGDPCDDGDFCTTGDTCAAGACVGHASPPCPAVASTIDADVTVSLGRHTTGWGRSRVLSAGAGRYPKQIFLRLRVAGVGARRVSSARLRLAVKRRSDSGGRLHVLHDCQWDELTTTWEAEPAMDHGVLADIGPVERGQTVEMDLTPLIGGDGIYCLALESPSRDRVDYQSREAPKGRPELVVETAP